MNTQSVKVGGMTCGHCAAAVKEQVEQIAGVSAVEVELDGGLVLITSEQPIDEASIASAVDEAGYALVA